jgi:hypothetical protein
VRARAGLNPMDVKRGIDRAVTAIADELVKLSRSVTPVAVVTIGGANEFEMKEKACVENACTRRGQRSKKASCRQMFSLAT